MSSRTPRLQQGSPATTEKGKKRAKLSVSLSVAMCTYNGAQYLQEQLTSIANQTRMPDEVVVCDDRSSDQTVEIVRSFARSAPFSVRLFINEQNLGPSKNFEKALSLCRGGLIALCDQDDYWFPEKLLRQSSTLEQDGALDGVFSDAWLMDGESRRSTDRLWARVGFSLRERQELHVERYLITRMLKGSVVTGATLMIRADALNLVLPVADGWMHDGWIAWMLALYSGIAAVSDPLIAYRIHGAQAAGVRPGMLGSRIGHAFRVGRTTCLHTAKEFERLRDFWIRNPGRDFDLRLLQIEEKIRHLHSRIALPDSFIKRLFRVLGEYKRYQLFDNGAPTMCKDLLVR